MVNEVIKSMINQAKENNTSLLIEKFKTSTQCCIRLVVFNPHSFVFYFGNKIEQNKKYDEIIGNIKGMLVYSKKDNYTEFI